MWLGQAPQLRILVTSRHRLNLQHEAIIHLGPLTLPTTDDLAHVESSDAVKLFVARAQAHTAGFVLDERSAPTIASLARTLDGLPLAIELAAARVKLLSPARLLAKMTRRFDLLKSNRRDINQRQATLRGAIAWSWDLLEPWEQSALAQASIFEGGFTLDAAEDVINLDAFDQAPFVMDVIESLVDKSLVRTWQPDVGTSLLEEPRFGLLVSIQAFAREQLHTTFGASLQAQTQHAHGQYYCALSQDDVLNQLDRVHSTLPRRVLTLELDNLIAGTKHALGRGDATIAFRCGRGVLAILLAVGPWALGIRFVETWLGHAIFEPHQRCHFLLLQARLHHLAGDVSIARNTQRRAHHMLETIGQDAHTLWDLYDHQSADLALGQGQSALAVHHLRALETRLTTDTPTESLAKLDMLRADIFHHRVALDQALHHYDNAQTQFRALGAPRQEARALMGCAAVLRRKGRYNDARRHLDHARKTYVRLGLRREEGQVLCARGRVGVEQGCFAEATADLAHALERLEPAAARLDSARVKFLQGVLHWMCNDPETAAQQIGDAQHIFRALGMHKGLLESTIALSRVCNDLGDEQRAERELIEAIELAEHLDNVSSRGKLHYALGAIARHRNEWDKALRHYTALYESARVAQDPVEAAQGLTYQGLIHIRRANWARAHHCLNNAMEHFTHTDPNQYMGLTLALLAKTHAVHNQPQLAINALIDALDLDQRFDIKRRAFLRALEHAAEAIHAHDPDTSKRALRAALAHYRSQRQDHDIARVLEGLNPSP